MLLVGLGLLAVIVVFLVAGRVRRPAPLSRDEFVARLDEFLTRRHGAEDWDAFCDEHVVDPELFAAQRALCCIDEQYPPDRPGELCNADGLALIRRYRDELRGRAAAA